MLPRRHKKRIFNAFNTAESPLQKPLPRRNAEENPIHILEGWKILNVQEDSRNFTVTRQHAGTIVTDFFAKGIFREAAQNTIRHSKGKTAWITKAYSKTAEGKTHITISKIHVFDQQTAPENHVIFEEGKTYLSGETRAEMERKLA